MKHRLLQILACPDCGRDLSLAAAVEAGDDIVEGTLRCSPCSQTFPIREGIPRFVDVDAYADTFSFEWKTFHDVQIDILNARAESEETFIVKTGWNAEDLEGKLVLDAGVGAGRFAEVASRWGGEVVGVDLSFAVDAARANLGERQNVHLVQADLFRLPFRENTFDAMYSIGVLHHTPDTKRAFETLVPLLREHGEFAVFLYAYGHYHFFSDLWRKITTRIPHRIVYYLSSLAIPLYYLYKVPGLGLGFSFVFPMSQHPNPRWRWLDTFDWYTPKYQHKHTWPELYRWFEENGFGEIRLLQQSAELSVLHINMRGKKCE